MKTNTNVKLTNLLQG